MKFSYHSFIATLIAAILIGAGLMAYAILFAVQGVGAFTA